MVELSEVYAKLHLRLQDIIPLDFASVDTLPDSYSWPDHDVNYSKKNTDHDQDQEPKPSSISIPVIDLLDPNAVELIGIACEEWGAFQVKNHGIPLSLIQEVEAQTKRFFSLPAQDKLKILRSPEGATGYGKPRISPFFSKYMWHEGFTIIGSPIHHASKIWPRDYQYFCEVIEEYQKKMKLLADRLSHLIFTFLGVSEEEKSWVGSPSDQCSIALQMNSYPPCPDPTRAMGLAQHTDTSIFTILHQSQAEEGLQVFKEGVGWIRMHPYPHALTVNVGDLLHIMSNGRMRCVLHRAVVNGTCQRYSLAYFYGPPMNQELASSRFVAEGQVPRFRSVTVKEYIGIKAKTIENAISMIRI